MQNMPNIHCMILHDIENTCKRLHRLCGVFKTPVVVAPDAALVDVCCQQRVSTEYQSAISRATGLDWLQCKAYETIFWPSRKRRRYPLVILLALLELIATFFYYKAINQTQFAVLVVVATKFPAHLQCGTNESCYRC